MKLISMFLFTSSIIFAGVFDFNTISSDFKQTITNEENSKIIYKGSLYATTQEKALWIYKSPVEKKIFFNKSRVVIVEPELEQAIITNLKNVPNLTELLKKSIRKENKTYETAFNGTNYIIYTKNNQITKIEYKDKLGNSVEIELLNQTINSVLDDSLFIADIPFDFDIISQ